MSPKDVVLISLPPLGGGAAKLRPALLLADLPGPYQNLLLCGISTQLQPNWDELIQPGDADFASSGLHQASVIRLSYLYAADPSEIAGVIGLLTLPVSSVSGSACRIICGLEASRFGVDLRTLLPGQIAATDRPIDRRVYEWYRLTPEEIKMVEENQ